MGYKDECLQPKYLSNLHKRKGEQDMRQNRKTQTIEQIMMTMEAEQKRNTEEIIKRGLSAMGRQTVEWKKFQVFSSSANRMKVAMKDLSFLFATVLTLKEDDDNVFIAVIRNGNESSGVSAQKLNEGETMVIISIKDSYYRKLSKK